MGPVKVNLFLAKMAVSGTRNLKPSFVCFDLHAQSLRIWSREARAWFALGLLLVKLERFDMRGARQPMRWDIQSNSWGAGPLNSMKVLPDGFQSLFSLLYSCTCPASQGGLYGSFMAFEPTRVAAQRKNLFVSKVTEPHKSNGPVSCHSQLLTIATFSV